MFANLIESASHARDLKRRSSFFFGTLVIYAVLLVVAGMASVYAYKAKIEKQDLEFVTMIPPALIEAAPRTHTRTNLTNEVRNLAVLKAPPIEVLATSTKMPEKTSSERTNAKTIAPNIPFIIDKFGTEHDFRNGVLKFDGKVGGDNDHHQIIPDNSLTAEPPKRELPKIEKPKQQIYNIGSVINGKAIYKFQPPYPPLAKQTHTAGMVTVNILVDETGKVVSAHAASGHPLLVTAAQQAAYQWRFSPTMLNNQPVKVSGVITFNFVLQ